jgi:hypothetical protein
VCESRARRSEVNRAIASSPPVTRSVRAVSHLGGPSGGPPLLIGDASTARIQVRSGG